MTRYEYVFQWAEKTRSVSVVGKSHDEVWRTAAKIWCPYMAQHALLDAVKLMRRTGAHILRRPVKVSA